MPVSFFHAVSVLECGAAHVAFSRFSAVRGKLRLDEFAREEWLAAPADEGAWLENVRLSAENLARRGIASGPVVLVLPGHLTLTKSVKTPRVAAAKRAQIIQFEAQHAIPYALTDVVWGHVVTGETAAEFDGLLCAAKRAAVESLCAAVETAGFAPRAVVPTPVALLAVFRGAQARHAPLTLLVEIGARTSTLLLTEPRRLHVRSIALGGQSITQQLAESQDCAFVDAEALKLSAHHAELTTPAVEAFATRLAQEITRSALHFQRQSGAASPERVLLCGGAACSASLDDLLTARLNVPVGKFDPLGQVEIARAAADAGAADHAMILSALVGAATLRLGDGALNIDLLPPRLRSQESTRRRQPWLAAAACVAAAALAAPLLHFRALETELRAKTAAVEAEIAPLRAREAANRTNLERLAQLQSQVAALQAVHDRRASWQTMLADLQDRLVKVEDVWLERMQLAPEAPDGAAPLRIAVSGRMLDKTNPLASVSPDTYRRVTELLGRLAESPFVSAVEGERFDNRQPGILRFDFVLVGQPARPL